MQGGFAREHGREKRCLRETRCVLPRQRTCGLLTRCSLMQEGAEAPKGGDESDELEEEEPDAIEEEEEDEGDNDYGENYFDNGEDDGGEGGDALGGGGDEGGLECAEGSERVLMVFGLQMGGLSIDLTSTILFRCNPGGVSVGTAKGERRRASVVEAPGPQRERRSRRSLLR